MNLTHALSAVCLASCLTAPSLSSLKVMSVSNGSIPPANKDITISAQGDELSSLYDVLMAVSEASGVQIHADSESTAALKASPSGFHKDCTISANEAWTVAEHALLQGGFVLSALHMGETKLVAVHRVLGERYLWDYSAVSAEDLDYVAAHPSLLFSMTLELPNMDVRTISNHMRGFDFDRRFLQVVSFGSKNLVLRGVGKEVDSVARMLLEGDKRAGERPEPETKPQSQGATAG